MTQLMIFFSFNILVKSWFDDISDTELLELIPLFEKLSKVDSVYTILSSKNTNSNSNLITQTTLTSSSSIITCSQQQPNENT